jgi:hypothetical protein
MTPKQHEQMLEFCRLAAGWYVNNQNTNEHPWGGVGNSADHGRFLYEYAPATGECRGNGVWGQAVAIMGLLGLAKRLDWAGEEHKKAALAAGKYLMSLQILDQRDERLFGSLREANPQWDWLYPRDGATGGMGFCVLYRETKDEEYLYRARLFADWYIRHAMNKDGWPCYTFDFIKREGEWRVPGVWQAGAGLMFYYLYRLTGEKRYIEEGLRPLMAGYKRICAKSEGLDELGQDDFAAITALGACLVYNDAKLLGYAQRRARVTLKSQDADGSCPGMASEYVNGLTWYNFCRFVREKKLRENLAPYEKGIQKVVEFAPTLQERDHHDRRAYGGLYGQTNFGVSRTSIHHRTVGYALIFMLRAEGGVVPAGYDVFDW